jgi:GntR family transcriptional regulator, transcriptional repressor for pyruvate dehydrogenase complex
MNSAFQRMPKSKTEHVAQRLLDKIIEAGLAPGSSFGTEAELLEQFGVSRPTLRESLRILESQGVLELRPGPGGGIMVKKPSVDILARGLSVFLRLHEVPFIAVLKTREVIEPALAAEAATNGAEEDFDEMQDSIERMKAVGKDQHAFVEENSVFHGIIARASGNEVMEIFWATISALAAGEHVGLKYTQGNMLHIAAAHQGIVDACRARDSALAYERMKAHLTEFEHLVRRRYQNLVTQPHTIPQTRRILSAAK